MLRRREKRPDTKRIVFKNLYLPTKKKDILKRGREVYKKIYSNPGVTLDSTELLIKRYYDDEIAAEKYEKQTGEPAPWANKPRRKKAQVEQQRESYRQRSPTPIRAIDDYFEPIDYDTGNNNVVDSIEPFQSEPLSSTPINHREIEMVGGGDDGGGMQFNSRVLMGTLENIGNTCYMNAVLYSLRFIPAFPHMLHHFRENMLLLFDEIEVWDTVVENECARACATVELGLIINNWPEFAIAAMNEKRRMISNLHAIFTQMTKFETENDPTSLQATQFQNNVYMVNTTFVPGTQQDSHEFLMCLLDSIRECSDEYMNLMANHPELFERINGDAMTLLNFNYFQEHFVGKRVTKLYCYTCESIVTNEEDIIDLTIPLASQTELDWNFIKSTCLEEQYFTSTDKANCENCGANANMRQTSSYQKLPRILIVHLGRFDNQMKKVHIATPTPFNMDCFCVECMASIERVGTSVHRYTLTSVIVHSGLTPQSGHYIAYVRSSKKNPQPGFVCDALPCCQINIEAAQSGNNQWYICNDDRITPISEENLKTRMKNEAAIRTPYVLFYVRDDILTAQ